MPAIYILSQVTVVNPSIDLQPIEKIRIFAILIHLLKTTICILAYLLLSYLRFRNQLPKAQKISYFTSNEVRDLMNSSKQKETYMCRRHQWHSCTTQVPKSEKMDVWWLTRLIQLMTIKSNLTFENYWKK